MNKSSKIILAQSELQEISWVITTAKALASLPRSRSIKYRFQFEIWNHYDFPVELSIRVESPSNVLIFRAKTHKMVGRSRLTSVVDSTFKTVTHVIPIQGKKLYRFSTIFRPHLARPLRPNLVLQYHILAHNKERNFSLHSDPHRLKISVYGRKAS